MKSQPDNTAYDPDTVVIGLDIDGTQYMYADPSQDVHSDALIATLSHLREENRAFVVHDTGRPFPWKCYGDINDRYLNPRIAEPDVMVSHAGTVVWWPPFDKPDQEWRNHILSKTSLEEIDELKTDLQAIGLDLHPEAHDAEFKISCLVGDVDQQEVVASAKELIAQKYGGRFEVFFWNSATVDVTPVGANKKDALNYVRGKVGLGQAKTIVAGDSMNDYPMLAEPKFSRILVGNASSPLKDAFARQQGAFIADESQPAAQGVLAGLAHFGVTEPNYVPAPRTQRVWSRQP